MKLKYILSIFFIFICFHFFYPQQNTTTIIDSLTTKEQKQQLSWDDYTVLTKAFIRKKDYTNALFYTNAWIERAREVDNTNQLIKAYDRRRIPLYYLGQTKENIENHQTLIQLFSVKDSIKKTKILSSLGLLYHDQGDDQKAYSILKNIDLKHFKSDPNASGYFTNFGIILSSIKKYDSAIYYFKRATQLNKENKTGDLLLNYSNIAATYLDHNKPQIAIQYLDSTRMFSKSLRGSSLILENYFTAYKNLKQLDTAAIYLDSLQKINEQIFQKNLNTEIKQLKNAHLKEKELQHTIKLKNNELERSKRYQLWGIILLLLCIIVAGSIIFFLVLKNLKTTHKNSLVEQQLLRSQMTPHFIFNSLAIVQGMILSNKAHKASIYIAKLSKLIRLVLENSRSKIVQLSQELKVIQLYLDLQLERTNHAFTYSIHIDQSIATDTIRIPPMIIQPFIENAIEHGYQENNKNFSIHLSISLENESLICTLIDNGVGINFSKKNKKTGGKKGVSTIITTKRLSLLSKQLKSPGNLIIKDNTIYGKNGTVITITIPYKIIANEDFNY